MKIVCRDHIDLSVSVERAFTFATDIARWPMWFGCMVNAHLPENEALELGAVLLLSLEGELSAARRFDLRFEQRGSASRISIVEGYPVFGGMIPALFDALFRRPRARRTLHESLVHLRGLLEDNVESKYHAEDFLIDEAARSAAHGHQLHAGERSPQVA